MSKLETNTIDTISGSTSLQIGSTNTSTITLGASGDSIVIPSGATITNNGTQSGFGGTNTPNFSANKISGTISFSLNTQSKIILDNELYDTASAYDTSTGRFTVPSGQGGKYNFTAHLALFEQSNNNMTGHNMYLYVNGSNSVYMPYNYSATVGNYKKGLITAQIDLNAGDYVELYTVVYSASGTGRAEVGASFCRFSGFKLVE